MSMCTYLCISPAAVPMDRHSSTIAVISATDSKSFGFRTVLTTCREGGSLAVAAFHEYPLPASILSRWPRTCAFSSASPLLCEMRIEELRARMLSVLFDSRCECRGGDGACGVASLAVGGAEARRGGN